MVIESVDATYAVTYGFSYFAVDKYCDIDFAFDFARRFAREFFRTIGFSIIQAPDRGQDGGRNLIISEKRTGISWIIIKG